MAFNYANEKAKFDRAWAKIETWYKSEGMSNEAIAEMRKFDWESFNRRRCIASHETYFDEEALSEVLEDKREPVHSQLWWVNELDNEELIEVCEDLSPEQLEVLSLYAINEWTMEQIANKLGICTTAVESRLDRISNRFLNTIVGSED